MNRTYRRQEVSNRCLLIFVHGFTGHYTDTWKQFPDLVLGDGDLGQYDVLMWGYPSNILGSQPKIDNVGSHLKTELDHLEQRYEHVVIAAHSMGGLVVRATVVAALLEGRRNDLTKIKQILLFGTPNEGIDKANFVPKVFHDQVADMKTASEFIIELRKQWLDRVYRAGVKNDSYHLEIPTTAVAGLEDKFVPDHSVRSFFSDCETTDGDHVSMVKPNSNNHLSFKILRKKMLEPAVVYPDDLGKQEAESTRKTVSILAKQLETKDDQLASKDEQIIALTKAVTALTRAQHQPDAPAGIEAALTSLSNGDTEQAEAIFQSMTETGETEAQKTAEAYRHLGALAFLHDTSKALDAYRRATELDPVNAEGWNQLGHLESRLGKLADAEKAYKRVLALGNERNDKEIRAIAYGNLGVLYQTRRELEKAEGYYVKSLALNESLGSQEGMANQYGNLGILYQTRGELEKAEEYCVKSLELNESLGRQEGMAQAYGNLGNIYQMRGELEKAEGYYVKSLTIEKALGSQEGMANQYGNLGIIYEMRGELDKAEGYYVKSLELNESLGRKEGMANQYGNLGILYKTRGELEKAEGYYVKSLRLNESLGRQEGMAQDYANLGNIYLMRGDLQKAEEAWTKSITLFGNIGAKPMVLKLQSWLDSLEGTDGGVD